MEYIERIITLLGEDGYMKYVMFKKKGKLLTQFVPVIFPNHLVHKEVAIDLLANSLKGFKIHSAGDISPLGMEATGSSITLKLKADPKDTGRIRMNDYGGAFE